MTASPKKPTVELVDLKIEEGSVVDAGDNPPAKIALLKNKDGGEEKPSIISGFFKRAREWAGVNVLKGYGNPRTTGQILAMDEFRDKFWKARMALVESMNSILECAEPGEVGPLMAKSVEEFTSVVASVSAAMGADKRAEIAAIVSQMTSALNDKNAVKRRDLVSAVEKLEDFTFTVETNVSHNTPGEENNKAADDTNKEKSMSLNTEKKAAKSIDELLSNLDPAEKALLEEHIKSQKPAVPAKEEDPALKDASPAIMKKLEEMAAELKTLRGDKEAGEIASKARRIARKVPGLNVEDVEEHLSEAQKNGGKEGLERAERMLAGIAAMARKGDNLRSVIGRGNVTPGGEEQPRTADELVSSKARKLMETEKSLTFEAAYKRVMDSNPQLAAAAISGATLETDD